jgi:hypothetical protein
VKRAAGRVENRIDPEPLSKVSYLTENVYTRHYFV